MDMTSLEDGLAMQIKSLTILKMGNSRPKSLSDFLKVTVTQLGTKPSLELSLITWPSIYYQL